MPRGNDLRALVARRFADAVARARLRACDRVGAAPVVLGSPFVSNLGRIALGDRFVIAAAPVRSHLVTGPGGVLQIGHDVRVAHGVSISAHGEVEIGDEVTVGPFAIVLDLDFHEVRDHEAKGSPRPVRIGRGVRLGSGVVVLRGATIGEGARVAPNSVVSRAIPPGAFAEGVPARPRS